MICSEKLIKSKQVDLFQSALLLSTNIEMADSNDEKLTVESNAEPKIESTSESPLGEQKEMDDFVYLNEDGTEVKQMKDENLVRLTADRKSYFFVYCSAKSCRKITNGKFSTS